MKPIHIYLNSKSNISKVSASMNITEQELLSKVAKGKSMDVLTAYKLAKALNITIDHLYTLL